MKDDIVSDNEEVQTDAKWARTKERRGTLSVAPGAQAGDSSFTPSSHSVRSGKRFKTGFQTRMCINKYSP